MFLPIFMILSLLHGLNAAEIESRIIGGESPPTVGKYPFVASLKNADLQHVCTGTIIDSRWIVTSANCINRCPIKYVGVGSDSTTSDIIYSVMITFVHDYYDPTDPIKDFDIGMIKTNDVIKYITSVKYISLSSSYISSGVTMTAIGWGSTVVGGGQSRTLKTGIFYSIKNSQCEDDLARQVTYNQLCGTYNGNGACTGDSGAPVVANNRLEGIIISETPCGTEHDVYTRIYPLINWINDVKRR